MKIKIKFKKLVPWAKAPFRAHTDDAGWDLTAASIDVDSEKKIVSYGTGLAFDFSPVGFADARARSSVYKTGLMLTNGIGTIDAGYRGEVGAKFYIVGNEVRPYAIGERILQLVFPQLPVGTEVEFVEVNDLPATDRGEGGFGSTGK